MKYRLEVLKPVVNADKFGSEKVIYTPVKIIHAERVKTSGRRSEEVGEHFPDYSAEWIIRDAHQIDDNWRVRQLGGHLYTVTNVIPNIDRGYNLLKCERVNE